MNETALLDEFITIKPKKGKLFDALIVASLFYIIFVIVDLTVDTQRLSSKRFDWALGVFLLALPVLGMILHLTSKKIGWIINSFYYLWMSLAMLISFVWDIVEDKGFHSMKAAWRGIFLLTLASICTVVLFSNSLRRYFRVTRLLFLIVVGISVALAAIMIIAILNNWT